MRWQRPSWWQYDTLLARTLDPVGRLYGLGTQARLQWVRSWHAPVPVICVGNVTAGGTGKTPVVLDLLKRLPGAHALTRGYGGTLSGPMPVDMSRHAACDVGDESLLLARHAPTWVAHHRIRGAKAAVQAGATHIVMDDGFQNPSLAKTVSFLVIDGQEGFGNGRIIPAGPLRERPEQAWKRASALVLFGDDQTGILRHIPVTLPVFRARLNACDIPEQWRGQRVYAFAGIGQPKKFFHTLRTLGADVTETCTFPDHYFYTTRDILSLHEAARIHNAQLVTTEKDIVRLDPDLRKSIHTVPVQVSWDDENHLTSFLEEQIL